MSKICIITGARATRGSKICARPRDFARIEDNQQTRRLRGVEKSRRYRQINWAQRS